LIFSCGDPTPPRIRITIDIGTPRFDIGVSDGEADRKNRR